MEKDKIFFGEKGISSSNANYLSNVAKEMYQKVEKELSQFKLYTTTVKVIGTNEEAVIREGVEVSFLEKMEEHLKFIANCKSLIAWLREAISAKQRLIKEAEGLSDMEICEILGIEMPKSPDRHSFLTTDDVIATWNIKQRNRYYWLETMCAVYGGYIHPDGAFSNERECLLNIIHAPNETVGNGRDTLIYHYEPTCNVEMVDRIFFGLQAKYREYQAELNSMKHEIELAIQQDHAEKLVLESKEVKEYQNAMRTVLAQCSEYRKAEITKAQSLKIIIPDALKDVYVAVSEAGK